MARSITQLSVFVSSPGGLDEHRTAVESATTEANKILRDEGVRLETFLWERDAVPGRSGSDAQAIINKELENNTDLLLLLMHNRIGSSTERSISGTIEEFEIVDRMIRGGRAADICVYFCVEPVSPLSDLKQLSLVQEFRKRVQGSNFLSKDYESATDLRIFLISHLVEKARSLTKGSSSKEETSRSIIESSFDMIAPDVAAGGEEDADLGPLDYEALALEQFSNALKFTTELSVLVERFGGLITSETSRMEELGKQIALGIPVDRKGAVDHFSVKLEEHIDELEPVVSGLEENLPAGTSSMLRLVQEWPLMADDAAGREALSNTIQEALGVVSKLRESAGSFSVTLEDIPGLTQKLKKAKAKTRRVYGRLRDALLKSEQHMLATITALNEFS